MNIIPQHDLVENIRKKLRDDKNKKIRKIINNGSFRLSEIFSKGGVEYKADCDYGVFNEFFEFLANPDNFKELIVSSGDLEFSNKIYLEKVVSPNGWSMYDPYDYWVQNYDELIDLHNLQI